MIPDIDSYSLQSIPDWVKTIDAISGYVFTTGFVLNRIKDLPLRLVSVVCSRFAIASFALGNILQSISSRFYTSSGDRTFANLFTMSSLVGTLASIGFMLQPQTWIIWSWLFVLNNTLWFCAEYYRFYHPSTFPKLNYQASSYLNYVKWLVLASFCSATLNTLGLFFINYANPLFYLGLLGNYVATIIAFHQLEPLERISVQKNA